MAQPFKFELVSPEQLLVSEEIDAAIIPGADGEFTVLAQHSPLMTSIRPGVVTVSIGGRSDRYVIFGGFCDVTLEGCTVLAEAATKVEEIDRDDVERRIQHAREDLADAHDDDTRQRTQEYLDQLTTLQAALAV